MKHIKIRQSVFETNSSSTHSICIPKEADVTFPSSLHFSFGEFGWEWDTLDSIEEKASYLYTGLIGNNRKLDFDKIVELLKSKGMEVTSQSINEEKSWDNGYVDHDNELIEFLNDVVSDEDKLLKFLFSPLAFINTGNDNDDGDASIDVSYPHDEYYKGN